MRAERDPDRAVAYALAGLWDAVELLSNALDDDADPAIRADLERLVRSLPVRLASVGDDDVATAVVTERLAEVLRLPQPPGATRTIVERSVRRRCGA
ncbi:hypothetical protein C1N71_04600 [Agrococcus sp. SGAir0287]|nr:hypothetical protein C1N71_04600 [Agrococcus sp. SGAir0287]